MMTITIVSDLHLAAGVASQTGLVDPLERFFHDAAFTRLMHHLQERASSSTGSHRLVLLGDIFDFPRVAVPFPASPGDADPHDAAIIAKLTGIAEGHRAVFTALGDWLAAGLPLDLVPGNHDGELIRPAVQRHLRRLLARFGNVAPEAIDLTIYPWIYYLPGLLYAEHGQQYHDINSSPALVPDGRSPGDGTPPLGAAIDDLVLSLTGKLGSQINDPDSLTSLMRNVIRAGPRGVALAVPHLARLLAATGRHVAGLISPSSRRRRARYRRTILPAHAAMIGLPVGVLADIDRLAETASRRLIPRMAGLGIAHVLPARALSSTNQTGATVSRRRPTYLYEAAEEIHAALAAADLAVPFYIFGHSHLAEHFRQDGRAGGSFYLNSGSWSGHRPVSDRHLTFIEVVQDAASGAATARLMRWDDATDHVVLMTESHTRLPRLTTVDERQP